MFFLVILLLITTCLFIYLSFVYSNCLLNIFTLRIVVHVLMARSGGQLAPLAVNKLLLILLKPTTSYTITQQAKLAQQKIKMWGAFNPPKQKLLANQHIQWNDWVPVLFYFTEFNKTATYYYLINLLLNRMLELYKKEYNIRWWFLEF